MVNLQILDLGNNLLTGALPLQWQSLQTLLRLDLSYNALVSTLPAAWQSGTPSMAALTRLILLSNPSM